MGKLKEQMSMSRHERQGALVVLALILVVVSALWAAKAHHAPVPPAERAALLQWAAEADSARKLAASRDSIETVHKKGQKKSHKARQHKPGKKHEPRHAPSPNRQPTQVPHF